MKFGKTYEPGGFEPEIYAAWEAAGVFHPKKIEGEMGSKEEKDKRFAIVMPPPNANGNLHIGHGLTVAIEDTLTRFYRMQGRPTWYVPGADHAGFETWVVYERALEKLGKTRFDYRREELFAQVWRFVEEQRGGMELQLRALGASAAWPDLTFTLDENVVRRVYKTFEKMWQEGLIYRGEKLVNYCTKHQTAFADIEVEHREEEGNLWEIAYTFDGGELVVSTTRPETLFGDVAVAVNPKDERYKDLAGKTVRLPLTKREIPVILDEHAEMEYGTGVVKITPAHDTDDFEVGERHNLARLQVIGYDGRMLEVCGERYAGLTTSECRKLVLADLAEAGLLRGEKKIRHAVAHCYKCDTVIEPMLKEQWFINTKKLAERAISSLEKGEVRFEPESKRKVLINYLKGLKDWNISRQIPWGIAIPMFKKVDLEAEGPEWLFDTRVELAEIEVGGTRYIRDEDTFDTWFSSAHWPIVCTNWEEGFKNQFYPLNVMETGADILFAWVARMLMMGLYVTGEVPFYEVYLHGLVLDERGQKMSKSKGNVINPMDLVGKYGSDAFRLGILRGRSAGMNQAFSENSVMAGRNFCNKLWNISRFVQEMVTMVGPAPLNQYQTEAMGEDWICRELNEGVEKVAELVRTYRFSEAVEVLQLVVWDKYADWFIESQKLNKNSSLLMQTLEVVLKMLHPFAPFVTEAIWQNLSWTSGMIAEQKWPEKLEYDPISAEKFERLVIVVSEVRGALQRLREALEGKKVGLIYGNDSLLEENRELVQRLAGVSAVAAVEELGGQPRGMRLALPNNEVYLDVSPELVLKHRHNLEERILAVGRELNNLEQRMRNPRYVERAPANLVKETRDLIMEKEELIRQMKRELEVID